MSDAVLSGYNIGYDINTHETKFGNGLDAAWSELPQVGMPEAPMDGGVYLAVGQSWVKIDEAQSNVDILWHRPNIIPGQKILNLIAGVPMEPYTIQGSYLRNEERFYKMPSPNDITSVVWSAANLPDGLTLGESTGIISGTPTTPGTYTTNVTVVTNWGTDTKSLTIVVAVPDSWKPVITPGQTLNLVAGEEMEPYQITGTNLQLTPSLPSLESIISDNDWHLIHEYLKLNGTNDFVVGTEVTTTYTESTGPNAGVEYELPLILVDKSTAVTQSGEEVPALYFMSKYALPCTGSHVADAQGSLNGIVGVEFQNSPTIFAQQMTAPVNRYRDSAIRKWLNSTGSDWWSAQEGIAEPSYSSKQGFLSCISQDLASEIQPIKVQVHTASDSKFGDGSTDVMYDKVFLPSIEEVNRYINYLGGESDDALRAADGVEGHAWQYWKDAWNSEERVQSILNLTGNEPDAIQFYDLDAKEKKTGVWLRSARRDNWYDVWLYINNATQSTVDNRGAYAQYFRVAPCFAILGV